MPEQGPKLTSRGLHHVGSARRSVLWGSTTGKPCFGLAGRLPFHPYDTPKDPGVPSSAWVCGNPTCPHNL